MGSGVHPCVEGPCPIGRLLAAIMAHLRQSRPDSGLGSQTKGPEPCKSFPLQREVMLRLGDSGFVGGDDLGFQVCVFWVRLEGSGFVLCG